MVVVSAGMAGVVGVSPLLTITDLRCCITEHGVEEGAGAGLDMLTFFIIGLLILESEPGLDTGDRNFLWMYLMICSSPLSWRISSTLGMLKVCLLIEGADMRAGISLMAGLVSDN